MFDCVHVGGGELVHEMLPGSVRSRTIELLSFKGRSTRRVNRSEVVRGGGSGAEERERNAIFLLVISLEIGESSRRAILGSLVCGGAPFRSRIHTLCRRCKQVPPNRPRNQLPATELPNNV